MMSESDPAAPIAVSLVIPVRNEAGNIDPLLAEIAQAGEVLGRIEVVYVDDGSSDDTQQRLTAALATFSFLRVIAHDRGYGQSAAIRTGILAARGDVIVTLDGDGQNDPADIPAMVQTLTDSAPDIGLVAGNRAQRRDSAWRRFASQIGNGVRNGLLRDDTPDTGCSLKAFRRDVFLRLPYFDHMHRFLPALIRREGYSIAHRDVSHRPRLRGRSKYSVLSRLWVGLVDLFGVMWLQRRMSVPTVTELTAPPREKHNKDPQP